MSDTTKKKRKSVPKGGHRARDAAGRPLIGMFHNPDAYAYNADAYWARPIAFVYPELRKTFYSSAGHAVRTRRSREEAVRCVGSTALYTASYVLAPSCAGLPDMPLLKSLRTYSNFWWVNVRGGVERVATEYEARLPDLPPREGWTLTPTEAVASLIAHKKQLPTTGGERELTDTERAEHEAAMQLKAKKFEKRLATARDMVARYKTKLKLTTTLLKKWQRREKALAKKASAS